MRSLLKQIVGQTGFALWIALGGFCLESQAQDFPNRTIRIISPFAGGTAGDVLGRITVENLGRKLSSSVVLENRPGASGTVGAKYVVDAAPDGYTLLLGGGPLVLNQSTDPTLPFKVESDLSPVATIARTKIIMVTANNANTPKTLQELLGILKTRGEQVNYGSVGPVTMGRLTTAVVLNKAGVTSTHIAYKGSSDSLTALLRGDVLFASDAVSAVLSQIKSNNLRPLAVASQNRIAVLPDVPTFAEAGVPGVDVNVWYGIFAPPKTPAAVVRRLSDGFGAVVADADYRNRLADIQFETFRVSDKAFHDFILKELAFWQQFFQSSGIKLEQ